MYVALKRSNKILNLRNEIINELFQVFIKDSDKFSFIKLYNVDN